MKLNMSLSNIEKEFKRISVEIDNASKVENTKTVFSLLNDLVLATPIDTGNARESWNLSVEKDFIIKNDAEYIEYLNEGSSKQAPARFIESTALKYGKPLGMIVDISK